MKGYIALALAIVTEVVGTTMLKLSEGFTHLWPSVGFILGFGISFYSLSLCLKSVPLSMAYAIWSGVGTALTALIGVLVWRDPLNMLTLAGLAFIIGGVVLLHTSQTYGKRGKAVSKIVGPPDRLDVKNV